jgi:acylphosphatase
LSVKTVRVRIEGMVQGIWYRGWTMEQARARGLDGWVRNRHDGSVEAVFSGPSQAVDEMIDACGQGPGLACVEAVHVSDEQDNTDDGFEQKSTV